MLAAEPAAGARIYVCAFEAGGRTSLARARRRRPAGARPRPGARRRLDRRRLRARGGDRRRRQARGAPARSLVAAAADRERRRGSRRPRRRRSRSSGLLGAPPRLASPARPRRGRRRRARRSSRRSARRRLALRRGDEGLCASVEELRTGGRGARYRAASSAEQVHFAWKAVLQLPVRRRSGGSDARPARVRRAAGRVGAGGAARAVRDADAEHRGRADGGRAQAARRSTAISRSRRSRSATRCACSSPRRWRSSSAARQGSCASSAHPSAVVVRRRRSSGRGVRRRWLAAGPNGTSVHPRVRADGARRAAGRALDGSCRPRSRLDRPWPYDRSRVSPRCRAGRRIERRRQARDASTFSAGDRRRRPGRRRDARSRAPTIEVLAAIDARGSTRTSASSSTALGLQLDPASAARTSRRVVADARARGNFVRIDMEDSSTTDDTLRLYRELREAGLRQRRHRPPGLPAANRDDVRALADLRPNVRLCKGIYVEPAEIAYREPEASARASSRPRRAARRRVLRRDRDPRRMADRCARSSRSSAASSRRSTSSRCCSGSRGPPRRARPRGHRLRVYVPFGQRWYEYSLRRLQENPKIAGYVARDLLNRFVPGR